MPVNNCHINFVTLSLLWYNFPVHLIIMKTENEYIGIRKTTTKHTKYTTYIVVTI